MSEDCGMEGLGGLRVKFGAWVVGALVGKQNGLQKKSFNTFSRLLTNLVIVIRDR